MYAPSPACPPPRWHAREAWCSIREPGVPLGHRVAGPCRVPTIQALHWGVMTTLLWRLSAAHHRWRLQPLPLTWDRLWLAGEWLVIVLWTLVLTRPYLSLDPLLTPIGSEYFSAIQTHHVWTRAQECGFCALWNGSVRGGAPAFVDPHGSYLHPLVVVTTLGWGVQNGAKLALVGAFAMAGLAQWWLGYVMGVGRVARVWSAAMAVAGGQLAGRMELGAFGVVLATAACALVLPPLLAVALRPNGRAVVALGVSTAAAIVAGQGYMQVGFLFTLPAVLLLFLWEPRAHLALAARYALAGGLALLLAAPFLLPFLPFLPEFGKAVDPTFSVAQPFPFVPLNLVINDHAFYVSDALRKIPYPHLNVNYVGWVAVLLALGGLFTAQEQRQRRIALFLAASALLAFWAAAAGPLRAIHAVAAGSWSGDLAAGVRHPAQMAGLAVAPVLGLAAMGLDRLLHAPWPRWRLGVAVGEGQARAFRLDPRWLLAIPLVWALLDARAFGSIWIGNIRQTTDRPVVLEALRTAPDVQWINAPFGEHCCPAGGRDGAQATHRYSDVVLEGPAVPSRSWRRIARARPGHEPARHCRRRGDLRRAPGREYAVIDHGNGRRTVCSAYGTGGDLDVLCEAPRAGCVDRQRKQLGRLERDGQQAGRRAAGRALAERGSPRRAVHGGPALPTGGCRARRPVGARRRGARGVLVAVPTATAANRRRVAARRKSRRAPSGGGACA